MTPPYKTCAFVLPSGKTCGAPASDRSDYKFCFLHDPSIKSVDDVVDEDKLIVKEVLKRKKLIDYPAKTKSEEAVAVEEFDRHAEVVVEDEKLLPLETPEDIEEAMRRVLQKQMTGQVSEEYANNVIKNLNTLYGVMAVNDELRQKLKRAIEITKGGKDAQKG